MRVWIFVAVGVLLFALLLIFLYIRRNRWPRLNADQRSDIMAMERAVSQSAENCIAFAPKEYQNLERTWLINYNDEDFVQGVERKCFAVLDDYVDNRKSYAGVAQSMLKDLKRRTKVYSTYNQ